MQKHLSADTHIAFTPDPVQKFFMETPFLAATCYLLFVVLFFINIIVTVRNISKSIGFIRNSSEGDEDADKYTEIMVALPEGYVKL